MFITGLYRRDDILALSDEGATFIKVMNEKLEKLAANLYALA